MVPDWGEEDNELNLLLVDDDPSCLTLTSDILEQDENVRTRTTTSPSEALEIVEEDDGFDGIISDYKMPEMDGIEFLSEVKENRDIPFFLLTSNSREDVAIDALNKGADGYFQKNMEVDDYQVILDKMWGEVDKRKTEKREKQLMQIIDNLEAGIYKIDAEMNFEFMNKTLRETLGLQEVEDIYLSDFSEIGIVPDDEIDEVIKDYEDASENPSENWHDVKLPNGEEATIYANIVPLEDGGYAGAVYDVTKLKQEKEKSELLSSTLTHDVKNKLAAMRGYIDLIDDDELSEEDQEHYEKAVSNLEEAVEISEKVSRVRGLAQDKNDRIVSVDRTMSSAIEDLETEAEENNIQINYNPETGVAVYGDDIIENMFYNIIENSIEHSECSEIDVEITEESDQVEVYISDNGKGMDIEVEEGSFEEYRSLGTYLISEIARLNDFEMNIETGDQGTEYVLRKEVAGK